MSFADFSSKWAQVEMGVTYLFRTFVCFAALGALGPLHAASDCPLETWIAEHGKKLTYEELQSSTDQIRLAAVKALLAYHRLDIIDGYHHCQVINAATFVELNRVRLCLKDPAEMLRQNRPRWLQTFSFLAMCYLFTGWDRNGEGGRTDFKFYSEALGLGLIAPLNGVLKKKHHHKLRIPMMGHAAAVLEADYDSEDVSSSTFPFRDHLLSNGQVELGDVQALRRVLANARTHRLDVILFFSMGMTGMAQAYRSNLSDGKGHPVVFSWDRDSKRWVVKTELIPNSRGTGVVSVLSRQAGPSLVFHANQLDGDELVGAPTEPEEWQDFDLEKFLLASKRIDAQQKKDDVSVSIEPEDVRIGERRINIAHANVFLNPKLDHPFSRKGPGPRERAFRLRSFSEYRVWLGGMIDGKSWYYRFERNRDSGGEGPWQFRNFHCPLRGKIRDAFKVKVDKMLQKHFDPRDSVDRMFSKELRTQLSYQDLLKADLVDEFPRLILNKRGKVLHRIERTGHDDRLAYDLGVVIGLDDPSTFRQTYAKMLKDQRYDSEFVACVCNLIAKGFERGIRSGFERYSSIFACFTGGLAFWDRPYTLRALMSVLDSRKLINLSKVNQLAFEYSQGLYRDDDRDVVIERIITEVRSAVLANKRIFYQAFYRDLRLTGADLSKVCPGHRERLFELARAYSPGIEGDADEDMEWLSHLYAIGCPDAYRARDFHIDLTDAWERRVVRIDPIVLELISRDRNDLSWIKSDNTSWKEIHRYVIDESRSSATRVPALVILPSKGLLECERSFSIWRVGEDAELREYRGGMDPRREAPDLGICDREYYGPLCPL